jgi:hypothetical protein
MNAQLEQMVAAALEQREAAHKTMVAGLRKRIEDLEREPDPAKAPFRGTSAAAIKTPDAERPSFLKVAQERDRDERIDYLKHMAERHPDPELRARAASALLRGGF